MWLERVLGVGKVSELISVREGHKIFEVVGNPLTTSISGLSKDSGSVHTIQSQDQHNNISLPTPYTLELDLGPFSPDVPLFLSNDQWRHLLYD